MRTARVILGHVALLWGLQAVLGALAHLAFDWQPAALAVSGVYLVLAAVAAVSFRAGTLGLGRARRALGVLAAGVLWQLPGLLGSFNQLREQLGSKEYDAASDLFDFVMQTWHTALMPLLSLLPSPPGETTGYYWGLVLASPVLLAGFLAVAGWPVRAAVPAVSRATTQVAATVDLPAPGPRPVVSPPRPAVSPTGPVVTPPGPTVSPPDPTVSPSGPVAAAAGSDPEGPALVPEQVAPPPGATPGEWRPVRRWTEAKGRGERKRTR